MKKSPVPSAHRPQFQQPIPATRSSSPVPLEITIIACSWTANEYPRFLHLYTHAHIPIPHLKNLPNLDVHATAQLAFFPLRFPFPALPCPVLPCQKPGVLIP